MIDDEATFESIRSTKHGHGSARAANKGKVKRRLKHAATVAKRKRRKR